MICFMITLNKVTYLHYNIPSINFIQTCKSVSLQSHLFSSVLLKLYFLVIAKHYIFNYVNKLFFVSYTKCVQAWKCFCLMLKKFMFLLNNRFLNDFLQFLDSINCITKQLHFCFKQKLCKLKILKLIFI